MRLLRIYDPALFLIIIFFLLYTKLLGLYFPYPWPDEVLFITPALSLISSGFFSTPVLEGIIPGMEKATLWMPPLYMLFLAFVFWFFPGAGHQELFWTGRTVSLVLGILTITGFYRLTATFLKERVIIISFVFLFSLELLFLRASNVSRMEVLNLLSLILFLYFLEKENFDVAGFLLGISLLTHPASIVPVIILFFYTKDRKKLLRTLVIAFFMLSLWGLYILSYPEVFARQFLGQIQRKTSMDIYGFETLFSSLKSLFGQYSSRLSSIMMLLQYSAILPAIIYDILNQRKTIRYFLMFLVTGIFVFLTKEMWYAVYPYPFFLLYFINFSKYYPQFKKIVISYFLITFLGIHAGFWMKHASLYSQYKKEYSDYIENIVKQTESCRSVFLAAVPDPFFALPGDKKVKEFSPVPLQEKEEKMRESTLRDIDCFVINIDSFAKRNLAKIDPLLYSILDKGNFFTVTLDGYTTIPVTTIYKKIQQP